MYENNVLIKDKYYYSMYNLIVRELKKKNILNYVKSDAIEYLSNCNLLIVDIYKVIALIDAYLEKYNGNKIETTDLKNILNTLG